MVSTTLSSKIWQPRRRGGRLTFRRRTLQHCAGAGRRMFSETLSHQAPDVERPRRDARKRSDRAFRHRFHPGYCIVFDERVYTALDAHMIAFHLELAQLWRCLVEWCMAWNGSVHACLEHLTEKHGGSAFFSMKNVAKFFPP